MIKRSLKQIMGMIDCKADSTYEEVEISGISIDSRSVHPGNLFVPLAGESFDGHDFALQALENGASAVMWQEARPNAPEGVPVLYVQDTLTALQNLAAAYRQQLSVRVVGVTGSNGKTTTKDMIAACLATTYRVYKTQGNFNNHIGLPLTLLQLSEDTQMAVIEMGMSGRGEIELLSRIARPEAAVITNVGEAHLLQLGSRDEIAAAKLEITSGLREDGLLVYNGDEPLLQHQLEKLTGVDKLLRFRFGEDENNDYYPVAVMQHQSFTTFKLNVPYTPTYTVPLPGRHNVLNALAAIAIAKFMGVAEADIVRGLSNLKLSAMRTEIIQAVSGAMILNDAYNANPTSMLAAIQMLEDMKTSGRKFAVLGDMLELGEQEADYHREIGARLDPQQIDYIFTYGPLAALIAEEAAKHYPAGTVLPFDDKLALAGKLEELLAAGDICLIKASRGMKLEDVVAKLTQA